MNAIKSHFMLAALLSACDPSTSTRPRDLVIWHDPHRAVTCWVWQTTGYNGALSCLPDKAFEATK